MQTRLASAYAEREKQVNEVGFPQTVWWEGLLRGQLHDSEAFSMLFRMPQIVLGLLSHPTFRRGIERNR
jgi:hypothetical protein